MTRSICKFFLAFGLFLQIISAGEGSLYTRYGLGDVYMNFSARRLGIGGLGFAVADENNLSTLNPANWYRLALTRIELGVDYRGLKIRDVSNSAYYPEYAFSGFVIGFPVHKDLGIAVVTGIVPATRVNYEVIEYVTGGVDDYTATYSGKGGLSKLFLGGSYKTPFDFILGASFEYYTGGIDYSSGMDFGDLSDYRDAKFTRSLDFRGIGGNFGLISNDLAALFGFESIKDWRIALNFHIVGKLSTDTTLTINNANGETVSEIGVVKTKYPVKLGIGTSFKLAEKYLFLVDYLYQPWTDFAFNGLYGQNLKDLHALSLGFEYAQNASQFATFWEQIILRGGLSFVQTQYEINKTEINEMGIHAGVSFPLTPANTIDIGLKYGVRGTSDAGLVQENIFRVSITLSFGELWFQREER